MAGIPPQLHKRLRNVLLECEQFATDETLRAVVFPYAPLRPWRFNLPQGNNIPSRVDGVIGYLVDKRRGDTKENALVLFVRLLSEQIDEADERYQQLKDLAAELEETIDSSTPTTNSQENLPRVVILTAIPVEYKAVSTHLTELREETHPQGTIYERGKFTANGKTWEVGIVEVGAGNSGAAVEAERAIAYFNPEIIFFVGVAGGIKDVALADVVAATKVYGYESGKAEIEFKPRPDVGLSAYKLIQRARSEARKAGWLQRLKVQPNTTPKVFVAPIAAGEKVVASTESSVLQFLQFNYGDAIAVEMEGRGILQAAHANQQVSALIVRGISDLIDGKSEADAGSSQEIAAGHASAFAFQILAKM